MLTEADIPEDFLPANTNQVAGKRKRSGAKGQAGTSDGFGSQSKVVINVDSALAQLDVSVCDDLGRNLKSVHRYRI